MADIDLLSGKLSGSSTPGFATPATLPLFTNGKLTPNHILPISPLLAGLLILLVFSWPCSVDALTVVVDTTADDPALTACDDAVPNDCSLRGAILAANGRPLSEITTIDVRAGTYVVTASSSCDYRHRGSPQTLTSMQVTLCVARNVALEGDGAGATVISGNQAHRVFYVSADATLQLRNVTVAHGLSEAGFDLIPYGGGIVNEGTLTLTDSVVRNNSSLPTGALNGGGIWNIGVLTLLRSTVSDNLATQLGGGIFNYSNAILTVSDSTIRDNFINGSGGGIANIGVATVTNSTLSGNTAMGLGGGVTNFGFPSAIATLTAINSTISGNSSGSSGGGISTGAFTETHLNNVTITDNTGATEMRGSGGGVDGEMVIQNTVIAGNTDALGRAPDCNGRLTSRGYNLIQNLAACTIVGDTTGNITGVDARLSELTDNGGFTKTHGLGEDSPAVDAGNPAVPGSGGMACAAGDQRGLLRPFAATCDIGAVERSNAFSLTKVVPNRGGNNGSVTALVSGGGFLPATGALLRRAGHADIVGRPAVSDSGGAALTTSFDLIGADLGSWDVVVTNPDRTSVTLPGGFTVETPRAAELFAVVMARPSVRPGLPARLVVLYGNRGNTDALGVPLTLGLPASFARQFSFEVAAPPPQPGQPFDDYRDIPIEVGADVSSDQVDIPLLIPIVPAGFTGLLAFTLTPPPGTLGSEFDVEAFIGTPLFTNGELRPEVVAEAATRAREFAAERLGVTTTPALDPTLIAYETAALELAVASAREELVGNLGQSRRVFSLTYFAIDLAGYVAAQTMASAAPAASTWFVALPHWLIPSFNVVASAAEAQTICPPCDCAAVFITPGCTGCREGECKKPPPDKPSKPPPGLTPGECLDIPKHIVSADGKRCKPDGSAPCAKFQNPFGSDPNCVTFPIKNSSDPNDKVGSGGGGPGRFIRAGTLLPYAIAFENLPTATAPAQTVVVTDQLDTQVLDLDSFALGPILIGDIGITPPPGRATFSGGADLRPALNVIVRVDAGLDKATGIVTWRFTSIDPATMEALTDSEEGFLPPNTNPPAGDGQVHFTVLTKAGLATGTEIRNRARIVFDTNAPIDTPEWLNTLDHDKPASAVRPFAKNADSLTFAVEWSGTDNGAGIAGYTIFASEDGGPFTAWLDGTADTSATFTGRAHKTYAFYSIAHDLVGNTEDPPPTPDAIISVLACVGDCGEDGIVSVDELVTMVSIALGTGSVSRCILGDRDHDSQVTIDEILGAVNSALTGCATAPVLGVKATT